MNEVQELYIEEIIKPLENRIKKMYIMKYKYSFFWTQNKEKKLLELEKVLSRYLVDLEKFIL